MNYQKDIEIEAKDFLQQYAEDLKEAIKDGLDFDRNEIDVLDSAFHETITDRAYTAKDAIVILEECENEETDSGLWEGLDWREQLSARAAYSYSADVWFRCEELYKLIKDEYETQIDEDKDEDDELLKTIFQSHVSTKLASVEKGSREEKELIIKWFRLASRAGMFAGYPLGSSYIDARCGSGHGMPDVKEYVDFDHEIRQQIPHLAGKYKTVVRDYYAKMFGLPLPSGL